MKIIRYSRFYENIEWESGDKFIIYDKDYPCEIKQIDSIEENEFILTDGPSIKFGTEFRNRMQPVGFNLLRLKLFHPRIYYYFK